MPWFITSIAPKEDLVPPKVNRCRASRIFGFFNTYNEAYDAVTKNRCDMHECLYEYIVIEYIEDGIHPVARMEDWWEWNKEEGRWEVTLKPTEFEGIVNWSIG
jgi:hypothetical protein